MTTITLDVPNNKKTQYKKVFSSFIRNYSIEKLEEINKKQFYVNMLEGVFDENQDYKEIKRRNGKLDFNDLLV